jgi:hypothetical protein
MGELKPLGSEKLNADEKLKRILELTYYQSPSDSKKSSVVVEQTSTGVYGIVREKDGYYVKKGLNEESLDYIGGLFMKNKNRFSSYSEAFKKAEFLVEQEKLHEAKRYILKTPQSAQITPQKEAPMAMPTTDAPMPPAPASNETPPPPPGEGLSPETKMDDEPSFSDEPESEEEDYKKVIQKLSSKLQQKLTAYKDKLESSDIKAAIMQVLSGVDIQEQLDETDKEEILAAFEPEEESASEDMPDDDIPTDDSNPTPPAEDDLEETDGVSSLEELINTPFEDDNEEISEENPFGDDEYYTSDDDPDETDEYLSNVLKGSKGAKNAAFSDMKDDFINDVDDTDVEDDGPEGLTANTEPLDDEVDDEELDELLSNFGNMDTRNSLPEEDMSEELPFPDASEESPEINDDVKELDINELTDMVNTSVKETLSKYFGS